MKVRGSRQGGFAEKSGKELWILLIQPFGIRILIRKWDYTDDTKMISLLCHEPAF